MADEIIIETTTAEVIEVGVVGPQGPAGVAGTGLETLTTQGDTLYRGASTGQRLPIGTAGQILKVSAGGIPEWGAAPASGVSSVNGETGAVTLDAADVGAMQTAFSVETFIYDQASEQEIPSRRNARWTAEFITTGGTKTIWLPYTNVLVGDRIYISVTAPTATSVVLRRPYPGVSQVVATISAGKILYYSATCTQIVSTIPIWSSSSELAALFGIAPSSSTSSGIAGTFSFSDNAMYVCIAPNTWRRVPIAAF